MQVVLEHEASTSKKLTKPAGLSKSLSVLDLMGYGVGCTVGAGVYSLVGAGARVAGVSTSHAMLCRAILL